LNLYIFAAGAAVLGGLLTTVPVVGRALMARDTKPAAAPTTRQPATTSEGGTR
jgi:hypothetical protein